MGPGAAIVALPSLTRVRRNWPHGHDGLLMASYEWRRLIGCGPAGAADSDKYGARGLRAPYCFLSEKTSWKAYLPPKPAACMELRDASELDEIPCMRSLKSSALEAV